MFRKFLNRVRSRKAVKSYLASYDTAVKAPQRGLDEVNVTLMADQAARFYRALNQHDLRLIAAKIEPLLAQGGKVVLTRQERSLMLRCTRVSAVEQVRGA